MDGDCAFHASKTILDAWGYMNPGWICIVEYEGSILEDENGIGCRRMRIIKRCKWTKKDSLQFVLFCLQRSLMRVNKHKNLAVWMACMRVIDRVQAVLIEDSEENRDAANAAGYALESVVRSLPFGGRWLAAKDAAYSAEHAAECAAEESVEESARFAWWSAFHATGSEEMYAEERKRQEEWLQNYVNRMWLV